VGGWCESVARKLGFDGESRKAGKGGRELGVMLRWISRLWVAVLSRRPGNWSLMGKAGKQEKEAGSWGLCFGGSRGCGLLF
jgi:hypothetical protein